MLRPAPSTEPCRRTPPHPDETPTFDLLEPRLALSASPLPPISSAPRATHAPAVARQASDDVPAPAHRRDLVTTGRNRYFVLEPGFTTVFAGNEDGMHKRLTITVTPKTRVIDGIRTRIVLERQTSNGHIEEIAQNYFAIHHKTRNVYYFGEDVNIYKHGVVVSHESAWRSGVNGAKYGLIMPGTVSQGDVFHQERAPGIAEDQAEVITTGRRASVPVGTFKASFQTRETTPLEPDAEEFKWYAPGIGLIQDDTLVLISHSPIDD